MRSCPRSSKETLSSDPLTESFNLELLSKRPSQYMPNKHFIIRIKVGPSLTSKPCQSQTHHRRFTSRRCVFHQNSNIYPFRSIINKTNSPKQAMLPSRPMYLRSYLAASVSVGSLSAVLSMAKTSFCRNSALSSKLILASKHTTTEKKKDVTSSFCSDRRHQTSISWANGVPMVDLQTVDQWRTNGGSLQLD